MVDINKLKNRIDRLDRTEAVEIFKIIHKNNNKYTQNKNGIFLDLNQLDEQSYIEIRAFIDFIEENKKHINEIEAKMKENKITIDNKYPERQMPKINNEFQVVICADYSPFITDLNDNYIEDLGNETEDLVNNVPVEDLNEIIDEDDEVGIMDEDDEDTFSMNQKRKKNTGIRYRILKKCKNINASGAEGDDYDKDIYDDLDLKELVLDLEVI